LGAPTNILKPKWAKFVAEYIKSGNASQSAVAAGLNERQGKRLLRNPLVIAEIDRLRKEIMAEGKFGLQKAMQEAEDGIKFAVQTENANAYATLVIHRAKLHGLVIDKADHRISGSFQINISGINPSRPVAELGASDVVPLIGGKDAGEPE
jgi:hypothetical protein